MHTPSRPSHSLVRAPGCVCDAAVEDSGKQKVMGSGDEGHLNRELPVFPPISWCAIRMFRTWRRAPAESGESPLFSSLLLSHSSSSCFFSLFPLGAPFWAKYNLWANSVAKTPNFWLKDWKESKVYQRGPREKVAPSRFWLRGSTLSVCESETENQGLERWSIR